MRQFQLRIIINGLEYPIVNDWEKLKQWFLDKLETELVLNVITIKKLPLKWKPFVALNGQTEISYGLDGIKEQLRQLNIIPLAEDHAVMFLYDARDAGDLKIANWTYPNDLNRAAFCEVVTTPAWEAMDDPFRISSHELLHCLHRLAWWHGVATKDTMDLTNVPPPTPYYREFEVYAPDGNRARNIETLRPYLPMIITAPIGTLIRQLQEKLLYLLQMLKSKQSKLLRFANAIQSREGYFAPGENPKYPNGTRSWKNKNPGNFRMNAFVRDALGATGTDDGDFATFTNYEEGFGADGNGNLNGKGLCEYLRLACSNQLIGRHDMTLFEFFAGRPQADGKLKYGYAPASDGNDPQSYSLYVAQEIGDGVTIQTRLTELV